MRFSFLTPYATDPGSERSAKRRAGHLLHLAFTFAPFLFLYASAHFFIFHDFPTLAAIELGSAVFVLVDGWFIGRRNLDLALTLWWLWSLFIICVFIWFGGAYNAGIFWAFPPALTGFLLTGHKSGSWWIGVHMLAFAALGVGKLYGIFPLAYDATVVFAMIPAFAVVSFFAYLMERDRGREEKSADDKSLTLATVLDYIPLGVMLVRVPDGTPILSNATAAQLLGKDIDSQSNKGNYVKIFGLTKEDGSPYPNEEFPLVATLSTGKSSEKTDIFVTRPTGERIALKAVSAPIGQKNHRMFGAVLVFEDVHKEYESDKVRSEYMKLVERILRDPVLGIERFCQSWLEGQRGVLPADQRTNAEHVIGLDKRIGLLMDDLVDVARLDTGAAFAVVPSEVDVTALLDAAITELGPLARSKTLTFKKLGGFSEVVVRDVDGLKMRRVLSDLLSSACVFSDVGGTIEVDRSERGSETVFAVGYHGTTLPKEVRASIFETAFRPPDAVGEDLAGTALGLYVAKGIIERHGGTFWFETGEGALCTVRFSIPRVASASTASSR
jgi:signal transduction histidine kinase